MTSTDLTALRTASYARNADRYGHGINEPCLLCAKPVKDVVDVPMGDRMFPMPKFTVVLVDGGDRLAQTDAEALDDTADGYCGGFPVGADCARRARKAGAYVATRQA